LNTNNPKETKLKLDLIQMLVKSSKVMREDFDPSEFYSILHFKVFLPFPLLDKFDNWDIK
jgi:hypothetical protein